MTTSLDPAYQRDIKDAETNGTRHDIDEAQDLEREFGYIQELPRVRVYHASRRSLLIVQTKSFFSLWMMTIVLSSVPYGLSTTLCQYPDFNHRRPRANVSLPVHQWRCHRCRVGLARHVVHLYLRCGLVGRDCL